MSSEYVDVLIVGAGISGIGSAWHLQDKCPGKSYLILEGREALGGTWDLFRYPGIRSDSDMHTLGYDFKPWTQAEAIADGPSILSYVRETAREYGIEVPETGGGDQGQTEKILEALEVAQELYREGLAKPGNPGAAYLEDRGIDAATIEKFGIGFVPDAWDTLSNRPS